MFPPPRQCKYLFGDLRLDYTDTFLEHELEEGAVLHLYDIVDDAVQPLDIDGLQAVAGAGARPASPGRAPPWGFAAAEAPPV